MQFISRTFIATNDQVAEYKLLLLLLLDLLLLLLLLLLGGI